MGDGRWVMDDGEVVGVRVVDGLVRYCGSWCCGVMCRSVGMVRVWAPYEKIAWVLPWFLWGNMSGRVSGGLGRR
jgi:hypothetical protein